MRWSFGLLGLLSLSGVACLNPEYRARLDDAGTLEKGSGVMVAGVRVGEVQDLVIRGTGVEVVFSVERKHQLTLHGDACALAVPTRERGQLYVRPGATGALAADQPIPQCQLLPDGLRSVVQEVSGAVGDALDGIMHKMGFDPTPATHLPPSDGGSVGTRIGDALQGASVAVGAAISDLTHRIGLDASDAGRP